MSATAPLPQAQERCAARADRRGDPMLGTAFPAARLLLVEEPFPWGFEGLRTSRFDTDVALALEQRCREQAVRVQAIRRPGRAPNRALRRWALVDTRAERDPLRWGEFEHDAELLDLPLDGSTGIADPEPLYLVCTHGKHDPCCAQRGRPIVTAIEALRPGRVWQASHLGGCRFSATMLVLPLGVMYGRVTAPEVADLITATDANEVIVPLLRGRIGLAPAVQAAVGFALTEFPATDVRRVTATATHQPDWYTVDVELATPAGAVNVTVKRERIDAAGLTCAAPGESWFIAHRLGSITPA